MADDKKKDAASAAPAAGGADGKKKSNLILVIGIIVGIVAIQTAAVYLIVPKPPANEEEIAQKAKEDSLRLASEAATKMGAVTEDTPIEAVVNISGTEDRFLKAAIIFEYDEKNEALGAELRRRAPKYKDLLINHLGSLSFTEVSDPGERDKIRKDLQRMINASLPAKMGEVRDVLFTTYIIQ